MEKTEFRRGERLWLCGREVTFVEYRRFEYQRSRAPRIGAAVVQRDGEAETRDAPLWLLARDCAESVSRANAIPIQLMRWDLD
jgi:hypothetical protein